MSASTIAIGVGRLSSDMVLVHRVFRRELGLLPTLIRSVPLGDASRAKLLATHSCDLTTALRSHHAAEADLLWRRLDECEPLAPEVHQQLLGCHRRHAELISELDALLPLWQHEPEPELQTVLADIVTELATAVDEHLNAVEEFVLPVLDRQFTDAEWRSLGLRAARWIPLHRMAWLLGAMLEDATPAERSNLLAKVPAPARLLLRTVGQAQYEREMRELRGTAPLAR